MGRRGGTQSDAPPVRLVAEFCLMAGLPNDMRRDLNVRQAIIRESRIDPGERFKRTSGFVEELSRFVSCRA